MSITTFPPVAGQVPPLPPQGSVVRIAGTKPRRSAGSSSGIWVGIFVITMSFAAFTSTLFVRQGSGDWIHVVLPRLIYANTGVLLLSSISLEMARRAFAGARERMQDGARELSRSALSSVLGSREMPGARWFLGSPLLLGNIWFGRSWPRRDFIWRRLPTAHFFMFSPLRMRCMFSVGSRACCASQCA